MKKFIVFLIAAVTLLSGFAWGQITITKSDMPLQNDTVRISLGINPGIIDLSETGENYIWDYSDLIPFKQRIDTFVSVSETPAGLLFLFSSDFAVNMAGTFTFPGTGISQLYYYFKSSGSAYTNTGFAFTMDGFPIPAPFSDPDIWYQFPLTYPHIDSSNSGVNMNIPGTGYLLVDRHRVNTVDGWGTLTTPYGTFDVIRVKSEVTEYDSVYLESESTGVGLPYSYTEYKWIGNNRKVPLLMVRDITSGIFVEYVDSIRSTLGTHNKPVEVSELAVYPNPVKNIANVRFYLKQKSKVTIGLYNLSGKEVWRSEQQELKGGSHTTILNIGQMNIEPGSYLVRVSSDKRISTVKFIYLP